VSAAANALYPVHLAAAAAAAPADGSLPAVATCSIALLVYGAGLYDVNVRSERAHGLLSGAV